MVGFLLLSAPFVAAVHTISDTRLERCSPSDGDSTKPPVYLFFVKNSIVGQGNHISLFPRVYVRSVCKDRD